MEQCPESPVVIYDGNCSFCRDQVQRLYRWSGNRLAFVSLHDPIVAQRFSELSHDDLMQQMYVVVPGGRVYGGADAIRFLSRYLPRLWWLMPFVHLPFSRPLIQWAYNQIAERRYRIRGELAEADECNSGTCHLHRPNRKTSVRRSEQERDGTVNG